MNELEEAILVWLEGQPASEDEMVDLLETHDLAGCFDRSHIQKALVTLQRRNLIWKNESLIWHLRAP